MNAEAIGCFKNAVDEIFNRWTGLKLAVEHMGGRNGQQVNNKRNSKQAMSSNYKTQRT